MTSLFSPFDYYFYFWSSLACLGCFFLFGYNSMFMSSSPNYLNSAIFNFLSTFFYSLKPAMFHKNFSLFLYSLFTLILAGNFISVWPYNFPFTSQVSVVMFLSLTSWVALIFYSLFNSHKNYISHLVPEGTPIYLTWFLFAIEVISSIIRPLTLMVRLVANILAGHLLMILLSSLVLSTPLTLPLYFLLNTVELFVSLIQSYIFCTMICLYFSEAH